MGLMGHLITRNAYTNSENGDAGGTGGSKSCKSLPTILQIAFENLEVSESGSVAAKCRECGKTLKGSIAATSNFLKHLKVMVAPEW